MSLGILALWNIKKSPIWAFLYLLLQRGDFLAFLSPYFLLSLARGSLIKNPAFFSFFLKLASNMVSALASPCLIAPAWPARPPPLTITVALNLVKDLSLLNGDSTTDCRLESVKYT